MNYDLQDFAALLIVGSAGLYLFRKLTRIAAPARVAPPVVLGERLRRGLERAAR